MKILGIETSCDDTGIALIEGKTIIHNVVLKQHHTHGVIPEYAARAHHEAIFEHVRPIVAEHSIDLIAYAYGPGLIGSLFVGSSFAKGLAYSLRCQLMAINHVEAHMLLPFWLYQIPPPCLCLMISGGHTMLVIIEAIGKYTIVAKTLDDAVGETFDKVARNLGLSYPGGPEIEKMAKKATRTTQFQFPHVVRNNDNFSFSGLKTAAIGQINYDAPEPMKADFCAQFQDHVAFLLADKIERFLPKWDVQSIILAGGVAANETIRAKIDAIAQHRPVLAPPQNLCTDNGLMIAAAAALKWSSSTYDFNMRPIANLPLV